MSLNAQVGVALYLEKASICKQTNGKFSLNDFHKKPIIADADTIFSTHFDCFVVSKAGQKGLYDAEGKCLLPIAFSNISFDNNRYWLVNKDGKQGLYSYMGKEIMAPRYDSIEVTCNYRTNAGNYFIVKKGLYGLCNNEGKFIVDPQYTAIEYRYLRYFKLTKGDSCHYLFNYKDIIKDIKLDDAMPITIQRNEQKLFYFNYKQGKARGLLRENGQPIIAVQYDKPLQKVGYIHSDSTAYFIAYQNRCYGMIDIDNNIILPFSYKSIKQIDDNGIVKLDDIQGKKKLFSMKKMQMLTNSSYDNVQVFPSYCILEKDGLEAFFDADEEKILLPLAYESITTNMYKSTFIVSKGKKFGIVNRENKTLVPFEYDNISPTPNDSLFIVEKKNEQGVIDLNNDIRIKLKPCKIKTFFNRLEIRELTTDTIIQKLDYNLKEIK